MTLHVICAAYCRPLPLRGLIISFLVQTNPNWVLHVIHDGQAPKDINSIMYSFAYDKRIVFYETKKCLGLWGHPNRRRMLEIFDPSACDYLLMTNDDNYYMPVFVEKMLDACKDGAGVVFCDTIHYYFDYDVHKSKLAYREIDMGAFIVRLDVAKKAGFNSLKLQADGVYADDCAAVCKLIGLQQVHIKKPLFVHN